MSLSLVARKKRSEMLSVVLADGQSRRLLAWFLAFLRLCTRKYEYPINRYAMETQAQLDVSGQALGRQRVYSGRRLYIAIWRIYPWYGVWGRRGLTNAGTFLSGA